MKKNLLISLLFIAGSFLFAEESVPSELIKPDPSCKIVYYEGRLLTPEGDKTHPYWFNQGVDLENYNPNTDPGLEELTKNEIEKVKNAENFNENYYLVGHSQGGPRTLGYATMLKQLSEQDSSYDYIHRAWNDLGENENDGLVAKSCQSIPGNLHSNVVGVIEYPELSHTLISPVQYYSPKEHKPIEPSKDKEDRVNMKLSSWMHELDNR